MKQNIYDNQAFFEGYKKLRGNKNSANIIIEKPCIFSLLPDLTDKNVLDMGCGYGENCKEFIRLGASFVQGIDISSKMLEVAMSENGDEKINYSNICMEDLQHIENKFDIIISSLAVHYISDFKKLVQDVFGLLNDNGIFIFSQEHPLSTAPASGWYWFKDEDGNKLHYCLSDYSLTGERKVSWIVDEVIKYHRTFSDIISALTESGFNIDKMVEPTPSEDIINKILAYKYDYHKPDFLVVKAIKKFAV